MVALDRWFSYTVTIVLVFAWADSVFVVLDEWLPYKRWSLNSFQCSVIENAQDSLDNFTQTATESVVMNNEEVYKVTSRKHLLTKSITFDANCKELTFPCFFNSGRFGLTQMRSIMLTAPNVLIKDYLITLTFFLK